MSLNYRKSNEQQTNQQMDQRMDRPTIQPTNREVYRVPWKQLKEYCKGVENYFLPISPILANKKHKNGLPSNGPTKQWMDIRTDGWKERHTLLYKCFIF